MVLARLALEQIAKVAANSGNRRGTTSSCHVAVREMILPEEQRGGTGLEAAGLEGWGRIVGDE